MPSWIIGIIANLALPVLKMLLRVILMRLESKYPGIAPLVDAILKFLDNGGTTEVIQSHVEAQMQLLPNRENLRV